MAVRGANRPELCRPVRARLAQGARQHGAVPDNHQDRFHHSFAVPSNAVMTYRDIGGMSASLVGMGCNQLGVTCDAEGAAVLVNEALDAGINYFDVADEYGRKYWDQTDPTWGLAEEYLGRALRGRRDGALIATKFGVRPPTRPELGGASAKWIATAVEASLRRLETDRIDLYQLHLPDPSVPIGETLTALDGLVRAGKVRAIGCSN